MFHDLVYNYHYFCFIFFKEAKRTSEKDGLAHEMTPLKSEGSDYFLFYFLFYLFWVTLCYIRSVFCEEYSILY